MAFVDQSANAANPDQADKPDQVGPPPTDRPDPKETALAKLITQRWDSGRQDLGRARRHYWENLAFVHGEQWVWWDPIRSQLQGLPRAYSPLGPGKSRITINRILPNLENVLGRMLAMPLNFEVTPTDAADDVVTGANLAEQVLQAEHDDEGWEQIRRDSMFDAILGATSAVSIEWDATKGVPLEIDSRTNRVVGTGGVRLTNHAITEFCLEPGVRDERDARWWISGLTMTPREAQSRYNLPWVPSADASALMSPLQHRVLADSGRAPGRNVVLVLCCYELPNAQTPDGRFSVVVNNRVVHDEPWPFPWKDHLNVWTFRQTQISGQWTGWTFMNSAVRIQAAFNHARSIIHEHMKKVSNARMIAPEGAFSTEDITDDPDSVLFYVADIAQGAPGYLTPPELPRWILNEAEVLRSELNETMHVGETSQGVIPGDRTSGQALAVSAEKDDSPLGLMGNEQAEQWGQIGEHVLRLYAVQTTETRKINMRGPANVPVVATWSGQQLRGQTRVYVSRDSTRPMSKAANQAFWKDLWDRKIVTDPVQYGRAVDLPVDELEQILNADVSRAQRENGRLLMGVPEIPEKFDDHATHIAEHNRFRKTDSYQYADPEKKHLIDAHVMAHEMMAHEELGAQQSRAMENPALAAAPQAHEPMGSMVPPDFTEQQAGIMPGPANPPQNSAGGPPQAPGSDQADFAGAPGLTSGV